MPTKQWWHYSRANRLDRRLGAAGHSVVFAMAARPLRDARLDATVTFIERGGVGPAQALLNQRCGGKPEEQGAKMFGVAADQCASQGDDLAASSNEGRCGMALSCISSFLFMYL